MTSAQFSPVAPRGGTSSAGPGPPASWAPIGIGRSDGTVVVTLAGCLDASGSGWVEHLLGDLVDGQGNLFVAIDLRRVERADPSVLALLVVFSVRAAGHGGHLVLREPSATVLEGLDRAAPDDSLDMLLESSCLRCPRGVGTTEP